MAHASDVICQELFASEDGGMGWQPAPEAQPHVYADADFSGCPRTLRSTSGAQIHIEGSNTHFPSLARSIRQQATAYSTPNAELAASNIGF